MEELITACGCELWLVPSYSPDLSPIEQAFARRKTAWRRAEARIPDVLYESITGSLPTIAHDECAKIVNKRSRKFLGSSQAAWGMAKKERSPPVCRSFVPCSRQKASASCN